MMDCKQFRDVLDCYVDGELSPEAMAAADSHRRDCVACARAAAALDTLRSQLRQLVKAAQPPADLEHRVRQALRGASGSRTVLGSPRTWRLAAAAVFVVVLGGAAGIAGNDWMRAHVVSALDQAVLRLDDSQSVVLDATVLCRDCELAHRYGARAECDRIGHHGALATADGRLWNIVEQQSTAPLIHDGSLLGRKVRVRGRLFRDSGAIAIESYEEI